MDQRRRAGMTDVARLAGVSHQTVSRVINSHPSVRPTTRERVLEAMRELDYRPNRLARALVTSRSQLLGVVTSGSARWGPMSTLIAIEEAARGSDYSVHVRTVRTPPDPAAQGGTDPAMETALIGFDTEAVDGVVVIAPRVSTVASLDAIASRAPLMLVAAGVTPSPRYDVVGVDQRAGARAATRHLIELGHRRIGHLAGPSDWFDALERHRGWQEELSAASLPAGPVYEGDWSAEAGYAVGQALAADPDRPSAIVVANDHMAMGLLRALGEAGLDVPGDVSVTGFDDIEGTGFLRPPLTTVRQDFAALAEEVMARLLPRLEPGNAASPLPEPGSIVPELVVRASTGQPRR